MIIIRNGEIYPTQTFFRDLKIGDTFFDKDGDLCIKVGSIGKTGNTIWFNKEVNAWGTYTSASDKKVVPVEAELNIKEVDKIK